MRILITCSLLLLLQTLSGQQLILDSLDLNSASYKFYFVDVGLTDEDEIDVILESEEPAPKLPKLRFNIDSTKSFLIKDRSQLTNLKSTWEGTETNDMLMCWYDYFVYIVHNNKVKHQLRVNLECGQVVTDFGIFDFQENPFEQLQNKVPIWVVSSEHKTLEEGRNFVTSLSPSIILTSYEYWFDYNGSFHLYRDYEGKKEEKEFVELINQKYENEHYFMRLTGGGGGKISYTIYCDSLFYERFEFERKLEWRPLKPNRIEYFTEEIKLLKELVK